MPARWLSSFVSRLGQVLALVLGLVLPGILLARPRPHYIVAGHEKPVALLRAGRATYLVTEGSVFGLEGAQFVRKFQSAVPIQCAALADTVLWLGTRGGVQALNTRTLRARPLPLPLAGAAPRIVALFTDAEGALWVAADGGGVFRWTHGAFTRELNTPAVNAGLATADSSVWVATNLGLSRKHGSEWTRYNEEGVANHEIPDNIVEQLLPDNDGNLWVVMSEGICVFEGAGRRAAAEGELPTARFLGRPGNPVYGVGFLRGTGRLFATGMGLLLLATDPTKRFAEFAPSTDLVVEKPLLRLLPAPPGLVAPGLAPVPYLLQVDSQQRVWLAYAGEVVVLTAKQFQALVRASKA